MNPRDNQILRIAIPSIVSNITVPLLGLVDVAITGHLGAAAYIAAISIGSMVFNTTYWLFGFLRMGSSGLTSQALGRRDFQEVAAWLIRGLVIALGIGLLLILAQWPIREMALRLMQPEEEVRQKMLYLLVELIGSSCYSAILYSEPCSLEVLKPSLFESVRRIIRQFREESL